MPRRCTELTKGNNTSRTSKAMMEPTDPNAKGVVPRLVETRATPNQSVGSQFHSRMAINLRGEVGKDKAQHMVSPDIFVTSKGILVVSWGAVLIGSCGSISSFSTSFPRLAIFEKLTNRDHLNIL